MGRDLLGELESKTRRAVFAPKTSQRCADLALKVLSSNKSTVLARVGELHRPGKAAGSEWFGPLQRLGSMKDFALSLEVPFVSLHLPPYQRLLYDAYMGAGDNIAVRVAGTGQCIGNERRVEFDAIADGQRLKLDGVWVSEGPDRFRLSCVRQPAG